MSKTTSGGKKKFNRSIKRKVRGKRYNPYKYNLEQLLKMEESEVPKNIKLNKELHPPFWWD